MKQEVLGLPYQLTTELEHGAASVFGITYRNSDGELVLVTRRRAFPVLHLQLELHADTQHLFLTERTWSGELLIDDRGEMPMKARLAFSGDNLCLDSAVDSFTGTLTVLAVPNSDQTRVLALDAVFFCKGEEPQSSVLWDTSPDVVHHLHTALLGRRDRELDV